jgi:hypothetical protein
MTTLEQEIIEKFRLLDNEAKERVRAQVNAETDPAIHIPNLHEWLNWAESFGNYIHEKYGDIFDSVDTLSQIREERDNDIMGGN